MLERPKSEKFFAIQSLGQRDEQEDSYGICYEFSQNPDNNQNCFILADGMGGHSGGSVASQAAIDSVKLVVDRCTFDDRTLIDSLTTANESIEKCVEVNSGLEGMGTTLVVLIIINNRAFWISVGDSPLLCLDKNLKLHQLNEDHSMKPVLDQLVETGVLTKDHPDYVKKANQLRSALTGDNIAIYDLKSDGVSLAECKYLVLSSDGLNTLPLDEVRGIMINHVENGPQEIACQLINAIDKKCSPKQDNTTLIVIDPIPYLEKSKK